MVYLEGGVNVLEIIGYYCALVMKSMHFIWIVVYQLRGFGFFFKIVYQPLTHSNN